MEKFFPEITSLEDVVRLLRGGAIAGTVFASLTFLDSLLSTFHIWPGGREAHVFASMPAMHLVSGGVEAALILFLSWRVLTGRGVLSAILLLALFVMAAISGIEGGFFGLVWVAAYFGLGLMMLNALRAGLRRASLSADPAPASAS